MREKVHPNVIIGFVGLSYFNEPRRQEDLRLWRGWSRLAERLYLRPNLLHGGDAFPAVYVHKLADDLKLCHKTGMTATDFDSLVHHWATQGLNYYVLAKLLWKPEADVDALVDDYCRAGFGPAADEVKAYFEELERLTSDIAEAFEATAERVKKAYDVKRRVRWYYLAPSWYTAERLAGLADRLERAERAAQGEERALARVRFLREGLRYAETRAGCLAEWLAVVKMPRDDKAKVKSAARAVRKRFETLKAYYRKHATTWVIAPQLVRMISLEIPVRPARKR
jgi:hypothetical protein